MHTLPQKPELVGLCVALTRKDKPCHPTSSICSGMSIRIKADDPSAVEFSHQQKYHKYTRYTILTLKE